MFIKYCLDGLISRVGKATLPKSMEKVNDTYFGKNKLLKSMQFTHCTYFCELFSRPFISMNFTTLHLKINVSFDAFIHNHLKASTVKG